MTERVNIFFYCFIDIVGGVLIKNNDHINYIKIYKDKYTVFVLRNKDI